MGRQLTANVWVGGEYYPAGSTPPKDVADRITNPNAWGSESSPDDSGDAGPSYSSMKVDELKAEIEKRNGDRADDAQLSTEGKKADLVAVLEADDAA